MEHYIFLLGGHDLEMLTIAEMLKKLNLEFHDNNLKWDSALLSSYREQLEKYGDKEGFRIFGVELKTDVEPVPSNYTLIDHHGDADDRPASLEQIAALFNYPMDRHMRLIAANDRGYIPGMKAIQDITTEEIIKIREDDRKAQGVTAADELAAETAIRDNLKTRGPLTIVRNVPSGAFSAVCDRLYPYKSLLICNDCELCFYGKGAGQLKDIFVRNPLSYSGGGADGYIGLDLKNAELPEDAKRTILNTMSEQITKRLEDMTSYHIFYFPFKWEFASDRELLFSKRFDISRLADKELKTSLWRHVQNDDKSLHSGTQTDMEAEELFAEKQYFFEFVHPVLYDIKDDRTPLIRHYERLEPQSSTVKYVIEKNDRTYTLEVDAINLNLYSTGIGLLMFYLKNTDKTQADEYDIRQINQYGRRIMPPHAVEFRDRNQLAKKLEIRGLKTGDQDRYSDRFEYDAAPKAGQLGLSDTWTPSKIMTNLIKDIFPDMEIRPVLDDRMLVNCWYANDGLSQAFRNTCKEDKSGCGMTEELKDVWYKQVFIDESDATCQNDAMRDRLLRESTYFRWQKYGTLYGASRYSMICVTDSGWISQNVISKHVRTIYARLFELLIVQRASVLRFSSEVTEASALHYEDDEKMAERISSLYKEYIRFVNQIYFRTVTAQDQGIELYALLSKQFDTEKQIKALDEEINELNQYATFLTDRKRNKNGERLNKLATIFLPPTLVASIFGMNDIFSGQTFSVIMYELLIIIAFSALGYIALKQWLKRQ